MFISFKNEKGASLIEVMATITVFSIVLILVSNIFSYNIRQNKVNREQAINANIANGVLNYLSSQDYDIFKTYLGNNIYVKIDVNTCETLFNDENKINNCEIILSPLINNKQYTDKEIFIYIFPFYGKEVLDELENKSSDEVLTYLSSFDNLKYDSDNHYTLTTIIIIKSSINPRYDYILRGVITKW